MTETLPARPARRAEPVAVPAAIAETAPTAPKNWRKLFLEALAASSNVTQSAKAAGIASARAYKLRREDDDFARAWEEALCEGYDHLEMELLFRLREGEVKPRIGAKKGIRGFDNANALRLLLWHRETVRRVRARHAHQSDAELRASIDAKFEAMRERLDAARRLANPATAP
jgi:hypothetical protein